MAKYNLYFFYLVIQGEGDKAYGDKTDKVKRGGGLLVISLVDPRN